MTPKPTGWDVLEPDERTVKYIHEDRKLQVHCRLVTTISGVVWNCRAYESDRPHEYGGRPLGSTIVETKADLDAAVRELVG